MALKTYDVTRPDGTKLTMRLDADDHARYSGMKGWTVTEVRKAAAKASRDNK